MDHRRQTVLVLGAVVCILVPGVYLTEETETCQTTFDDANYQEFSNKLKALAKCPGNFTKHLEAEKQSELFGLLQTVADELKSLRLKACKNVPPKNCSFPQIPANGGLICLTHNKNRYCKPMCNQGYDFAFLRKSRLYEECGDDNGYTWSSQYIGGNRLAVCSKSSISVSGVASAYFPRTCQDAWYNYTEEKRLISDFKEELRQQGVDKVNSKTKCLLCGDLLS
ncbi:uncharacterized protein si:ch1073-126c3.2 [Chiloscyllium plagiosum]|uniref:uncharacterized protein si:ch1073-126c3.2 n=1 Tax=Chiloscyllium plagiosum TaxID=36176 RepID=UPI001CB8354D|nr:uncharacterized protein si:ch1073-126c3.2 [Chiloscyllium plagiosum]